MDNENMPPPYKMQPCRRMDSHNISHCFNYHLGQKDKRRDPNQHSYSWMPCVHFKAGFCGSGDSCRHAHGKYETGLHPSYYRTRMCRFLQNCTRTMCFHAHTDAELRRIIVRPQMCRYGADCYRTHCLYAHTYEELQQNTITRPTTTMRCIFGANCTKRPCIYAHTYEELQQNTITRPTTTMRCIFGANCTKRPCIYAHTYEELQLFATRRS